MLEWLRCTLTWQRLVLVVVPNRLYPRAGFRPRYPTLLHHKPSLQE